MVTNLKDSPRAPAAIGEPDGSTRERNGGGSRDMESRHGTPDTTLHRSRSFSGSDTDSSWDTELLHTVRKKDGKHRHISEETRLYELKECLKEGAKINAVDGKGNTVLHISVRKGYKKIVNFLVSQGAALCEVRNANGEVALDIARRLDRRDISQILERFVRKDEEMSSLKENVNHGGKCTDTRTLTDRITLMDRSKVIPCNTKRDGNCFFHAVFGSKNVDGIYEATRAKEMREEWYTFLSQYSSLKDERMPNILKEQLKKVFQLFLANPNDLTHGSSNIKMIVEETRKKIDDAEVEVRKLKNRIADNFCEDEKFRKGVLEVMHRARNINTDLDCQDLLGNRGELLSEISKELEQCSLILYPNLHVSQYRTIYNSETITDLFLENSYLYKQYLEAIIRQEYFVFYEEIPILASLTNTEITVHSGIGEQCFVFQPNQEMLGVYNTEECLWGGGRQVTILHEHFHYSHVAQEDIRAILPESLAEMRTAFTGRFTDAKKIEFTFPKGESDYTKSGQDREESKSVSPPVCTSVKVDRNLDLSRKNFRESLIALSRGCSLSNKEKIELQAFPSPYVLAQLSLKVYTDKNKKESDRDYEKRLQLPEGWKLLTIAENSHLTNGYVGASFWNPEQRQVVIAHRGTENFGSFCADVQGILWKKYASRMYSAITFADEIVCALREIPGPAYQLSFTGHSLGGWLAQITAFSTKYLKKGPSYFVRTSVSEGVHSHTVVFDSPGCEDMLLKMKKDFDLRYDSSIHLHHLDITSFLSAPNRINTSNSHVGKIYRIFTNLSDMSMWEKHTPKYNLATHKMSNIALVFDPETGEVYEDKMYGRKKIYEVVDWPISKSLLGGKEYKNFFKKAEHFNGFHPEEKDEEFASNEKVSIRYKTKHIDEAVCPIHTFSQDEVMILDSWKAMIDANIKLKILDQFASEHNLQDCNPLLPNFQFGEDKKNIVCDNKKILTTLVNRLKQLLRWFSVNFMKAMKAQFIEVPSAVEAIFKVETRNYLNSVMRCALDFRDTLELTEFLQSKTERLFHVRTEDVEFEVSRICNICKQFREINGDRDTHPDFEKYVDDLNHIILSWRQILNLNKFVDIPSVLEPKRSGDLLILTYPTQDEVTQECKSILNLLLSCLSRSDKCRKIIFVTTKECSINKHVSSVKAILEGRLREAETEVISLHDFTAGSQKALLNKPIIYLQNQPVNLMFFSSSKNREGESRLIEDVNKLIDSNMLKNLVVEKWQPIKIENELDTTDSEVSYVTIGQDVELQRAVDFLLNGENISKSVSDIYGEDAKSVIFFVSGVQEDELCRVLCVKEDHKSEIINAVGKRIHVSGEQHSSLKFKKLCHENPDYRIYWLDLSKGVASWKLVYDSDFYINRQFGNEVVLKGEIRKFFMGEPSHDFFIFGNASKKSLVDLFSFTEEESKMFSKCKNFQAFNHERGALVKFEEMRQNNRPVHLIKVNGEKQFIWQKTSGSLETIRGYVDTGSHTVDEKHLSDKKDKLVIISGEPGMGKSTSLLSISRKMERSWIIHKDFKDYQSIMDLPSDLNMDEVVKYLSKDQKFSSNDLTMAFFKECLVQSGIVRVVLLFDGFDEIKKGPQLNRKSNGHNKTAQEKVIDVLQFLNKETDAFVWVTSRRLQSHTLENTFSMFATKFEELNDREQKHFFRKFWLSRICVKLSDYGEKESTILDQYIDRLLEAAKSVLGHEISKFMGIPLQMRMIAEVMQPSFESLWESPDRYCKSILHIDNVFDLYHRFIEAKYNIYFHEKTSLSDGLSQANKNWLVEILDKKHRSLAFQTLFGDEAAKFLANKMVNIGSDWREDDEVELNRVGLIQSDGNDGFDFLHLTFAEYFVADLFAHWLKKPQGRHQKYSPLEEFLVQKILLQPEFKVVRMFLNNHLAKFAMPDDAQKFYIERITKLWSENQELFYSRQRQTCIHVASDENCHALTEFLLGVVRTDFLAEAYISLDLTSLIAARDKRGRTALYVAAESRSVEVIDKYCTLMSCSREHVNQTLLLSTVYRSVDDRNDSNIIYLLDNLSKGGCMERDSFETRLKEHYKLISPFISAAKENNVSGLKKCLNKCHDDNYRVYLLSCTDQFSKTALHVASDNGCEDAVDYLLDRNVEVNVFDRDGMTPLHHACTSPSPRVARRLVEKGSDPHVRDNYNMTTLAWSAKAGRLDIVKYLLELGVDSSIPDRNGIAPIQHAAKSGHLEVVEFLLEHGASMNATDKFGMSALSWAAKSGHEGVVRYLVEKGANIDSQDRYGMSVLQIAIKASEWRIVKYLVGQGADVNSCDWSGMNALQRLIKAGRWVEVKLLVTYGARLNSNDWKGKSALNPLIKANKWDVVSCLISRGAGPLDRAEEAVILRGVLGVDISKDTNVHNAFCRLIKLGNVRLLELLIETLISKHGFEPASLNRVLSKSYDEMNVKGVPLCSDMQYAVEGKLIMSRFFTKGESVADPNELSLEQIKQCIENVSESAKDLTERYCGDAAKEVDEAFVHTTKFITQNIHVLKKHLKNTYSVLPWEEMEFCLISFIYSTVNSQYTDDISRLFVDKDVILGHLGSFCAKLEEVKSTLESKNVKSKGKLAGRSTIIQNVIANNPEFGNLYRDYSVIKDIYSLKRIDTYLRFAVSVDLKKEGELGTVVIQRALQVIGESLKNTPESPNVSEDIHRMLLDSAPRHTKEIITSLRDSLSHADTLTKKLQLEEGKDFKFFEEVQNDLKKIGIETLEILYKKKIDALKIFLRKIVNCTSSDELVSLGKLFCQGRVDKINFLELRTKEMEMLEKSVRKLNELLKKGSSEQRYVLSKIEEIIKAEASKSQKIKERYVKGTDMMRTYVKSDNPKTIKNVAGILLNTLTVDEQKLKDVVELCKDLSKYIDVNTDANAFHIFYKIFSTIEFEVGSIKGIDEVKENLSKNDAEEKQFIKEHIEKTFASIENIMTSDDERKKFCEEIKTRFDVHEARQVLISHFRNKIAQKNVPIPKDYEYKLVDNLNLKPKDKENLQKMCHNGEFAKCLSLIQKADDKYAVLVKSLEEISIFSTEKYVEAFKTFFSQKKKSDVDLEGILKIIEKAHTQNVILYFNQRLSLLKSFVEIPESRQEYLVAVEMLILDLSEILEHSSLLADNKTFLLGHSPVLVGKSLRNYLAHGDPLVDLLPFNTSTAIATHARMLLEKGQELITRRDRLVGSACAVDVSETRERHTQHLQLLAVQRELFSAAHRGDLEAVKESIARGADPNASTMAGLAALDFAVRSDSVEVFKFLVETNLSMNTKLVLRQAIHSGSISIINYLSEELGVNINGVYFKDEEFLHSASSHGNAVVVKHLLQRGADPNARDKKNNTPLHVAAVYSREDVAAVLLEAGAAVDVGEAEKRTPLHLSSFTGSVAVVRLLLKHGARVNARFELKNWTPLHLASFHGNSDVMEVLLEEGAELDAEDDDGNRPLYYALSESQHEAALALIRSGAKLDCRDETGSGPLHRAAEDGHDALVQALLEKGVSVKDVANDDMTALHFASRDAHVEVVKTLVSRGADVDAATEENQWTPLFMAAERGHEDVVRTLLGHSANVDARSTLGFSALHVAAREGHGAVVSTLLENGALVDSVTWNGWTALHFAAHNNSKEIARILLERDARLVDVASTEGVRPIHVAAGVGSAEVTALLVSKGAKLESKMEAGYTPLLVACGGGFPEVVDVLLELGADVMERDVAGRTTLHVAAANGHRKIAAKLVKKGANVEAVDAEHRTALHLAAENGHKDLVDLLCTESVVNVCQRNGRSPLFVAAANGFADVVSILLEKGAVVFGCPEFSPLQVAALNGLSDVAMLLLSRGADANERSVGNSTPLLAAAEGNRTDVMRLLLQHEADVNASDDNGMTALHKATTLGYDDLALLLLEAGARVDARTKTDATALFMAARYGRVEVARELLRRGADASVKEEEFNRTAVEVAAIGGRTEIVRLLIDDAPERAKQKVKVRAMLLGAANGQEDTVRELLTSGVSPDTRDKEQCSGLHLAGRHGHAAVAEALLQGGATPNATDACGFTPLHYAALEGHAEVVGVLVRGGAEIDACTFRPWEVSSPEVARIYDELMRRLSRQDARCPYGATPLHLASYRGHDGAVAALLDGGARVEARDGDGQTAVQLAAMNGQASTVRLLLDRGAEPDSASADGTSALAVAAFHGHREAVEALMDGGARVDARNLEGRTALHYGAYFGDADTVTALLGARPDVHAEDCNKWTPLHFAAFHGRREAVLLLIVHGAVMEARELDAATPLHLACVNGHRGAVEALIDQGADVHATDSEGKTPLFLAGEGSHCEIATALLGKGADVNGRDATGRTLLHVSCEKGDSQLAQVLLQFNADPNATDCRSRTPLHIIAEKMADPTEDAAKFELLLAMLMSVS